MIISHRYRFIFIKTVKTAGTSIEVFLSALCGDEDVVTPIVPPVESHRARNHDGFYNHMPASELAGQLSDDIWGRYYKFCVERNPWDKVLSLFHMLNYRSGFELSFDKFVSADNEALGKTFNYPRYMDTETDRLLVDNVIRYEHLDAQLGAVFEQLGVPWKGRLGVHVKSEMQSEERLPYREVYTDRQRELISQLYRKEIDLHGYRF